MATKQPTNANIANKIAGGLNKRAKVAYILGKEESPTVVNTWVSTGCTQLDYAVSNRPNGGLPVRRIVEIAGDPSIGKSHIGAQIISSAQRMGGIGCYIDTEQAIDPDTFTQLGVNIDELIYSDENVTEDVLAIIEEVITSARANMPDRTKPIVVVWDSIAATNSRAEHAGEYDAHHMGVQARVLSLGMKKVTKIVSANDALLVCINQIKTDLKAGMYADPRTTPGGKAIPFHASVRIFLSGGAQIKDEKTKRVVGINVRGFTRKNKVAAPYRDAKFEIHFGVGIKESEQMLTALRANEGFEGKSTDGTSIEIIDGKTWKTLLVTDSNGEVLVEKKFTKKQYDELANSEEFGKYLRVLEAKALVWGKDKIATLMSEDCEDDASFEDAEEVDESPEE